MPIFTKIKSISRGLVFLGKSAWEAIDTPVGWFIVYGFLLTSIPLAGWASVAALVVTILIHELGHMLPAVMLTKLKVERLSIGLPSKLSLCFGQLRGVKLYITPCLLGGYVKAEEVNAEAVPIWRKVLVVIGGPAANIVFAVLLLTGVAVWNGHSIYHADREAQVLSVVVGGPAAVAGIQPQDVVRRVNGRDVATAAQLYEILNNRSGDHVEMMVTRQGADQAISFNAHGKLGVNLGTYEIIPVGIVEGFKIATSQAASQVAEMGKFLLVVSGVQPLQPGAPAGSADLHGLVGVVQLGASALSVGATTFLSVVALINLSIAVLNLLPVPILDGAQLVYLVVEKVQGKPLSQKIQSRLSTFVGLPFLVALFSIALYNDLFKPILVQFG